MKTEKPDLKYGRSLNKKDENRGGPENKSNYSEKTNPNYNLSELEKMAGRNEAFINHAVKIFIEGSEEAIVDFKVNLKDKKWKKVRDTAHKILPSYRHLQVNSVIPGLVEINNKIMIEHNTEGIHELVNQVISDIEKVLAEMRKEIR